MRLKRLKRAQSRRLMIGGWEKNRLNVDVVVGVCKCESFDV